MEFLLAQKDSAFFAYNWRLPAYSRSFSLTVVAASFVLSAGAFSPTIGAFSLAILALVLAGGICACVRT